MDNLIFYFVIRCISPADLGILVVGRETVSDSSDPEREYIECPEIEIIEI